MVFNSVLRYVSCGLLLSATVVFTLFSEAYGKEPLPAIEYVYPDQSVWTTKVDENGILDNPLLGFAETMFSKLKLNWSAKPYPAGRMFERLEQGRSNFSMLVKAPRLMESCLYSSTPVVFTELRVYRKKTVPPIMVKEDFAGKNVIVIRGYSYGGIGRFLRNKTNGVVLHEARGHESAFKMLSYDRADYLLDYTGPSEEILAANPFDGIEHDILNRLNVYLVLSKKYPDAERLMGEMEKTAATIDVSRWGLKRQ